jgi:hypothetical protein
MHAAPLLRWVEVFQSKAVSAADPAISFHRVNDERLAAILEILERAQPRDAGVEYLYVWGQAVCFTKSAEHMNSNSIVSMPIISKTHDV